MGGEREVFDILNTESEETYLSERMKVYDRYKDDAKKISGISPKNMWTEERCVVKCFRDENKKQNVHSLPKRN